MDSILNGLMPVKGDDDLSSDSDLDINFNDDMNSLALLKQNEGSKDEHKNINECPDKTKNDVFLSTYTSYNNIENFISDDDDKNSESGVLHYSPTFDDGIHNKCLENDIIELLSSSASSSASSSSLDSLSKRILSQQSMTKTSPININGLDLSLLSDFSSNSESNTESESESNSDSISNNFSNIPRKDSPLKRSNNVYLPKESSIYNLSQSSKRLFSEIDEILGNKSTGRINSEPILRKITLDMEETSATITINQSKRRKTTNNKDKDTVRANTQRIQLLKKINKVQRKSDTMSEMTIFLPYSLFKKDDISLINVDNSLQRSNSYSLTQGNDDGLSLFNSNIAIAAEPFLSQPLAENSICNGTNKDNNGNIRYKMSDLITNLESKSCKIIYHRTDEVSDFSTNNILQFDFETKAIRFKRTSNREWSQEEKMWIPIEGSGVKSFIEPIVIYHLTAIELAKIISIKTVDNFNSPIRNNQSLNMSTVAFNLHDSEYNEGIFAFFNKLQSYPKNKDCKIILLIEGLQLYARKYNKAELNARDRSIRTQIASTQVTPGRRARSLNNVTNRQDHELLNLPEPVIISEALVNMQILSEGNFLVQQSKSEHSTVEWLESFTEQISLLDEIKHSGAEAENLPFADRVASGKSHSDSWKRMLQEIYLCSEIKALSIINKFPTVKSLFNAYRTCDSTNRCIEIVASIPILPKPQPVIRNDEHVNSSETNNNNETQLYTSPVTLSDRIRNDLINSYSNMQNLQGNVNHWNNRNSTIHGRSLNRSRTTNDTVISNSQPTISSSRTTSRKQKTIGLALSKNIYQVLMGEDPLTIAVEK